MVQLKYFGDSRDYFKYDLITSVIEEVPFRKYVFIPMLTHPRKDNQGNKKTYNIGNKRHELLSFIQECQGKSLRHWETWLARYVNEYYTIKKVDETYFCKAGEKRRNYWNRFKRWFGLENALIFLDPDTGLETGKPSYLKRMGREKYLLNDELKYLISALAPTSTIMIYQHLSRNKKHHEDMVKKKLNQVNACCRDIFTCAYREDDLAFIFISKKEKIHKRVFSVLNKYHSRSDKKFKSIHLSLSPFRKGGLRGILLPP
jgi:hypothetical protein